jgi:hypothetical protein
LNFSTADGRDDRDIGHQVVIRLMGAGVIIRSSRFEFRLPQFRSACR